MADEHAPAPLPQSSTGFSAPSPLTPTENTNGVPLSSNGPVLPSNGEGHTSAKGHSALPEVAMLGRWVLGLLLVLVCGWGLLALVFWLTRSHSRSPELALGIAALLVLQWVALVRGARGKPATWRGRAYPTQ